MLIMFNLIKIEKMIKLILTIVILRDNIVLKENNDFEVMYEIFRLSESVFKTLVNRNC